MGVTDNNILAQPTNGQHNDLERLVESAIQNQVMKIHAQDKEKLRKAVDDANLIVENCMHGNSLTTTDELATLGVQMVI